MTTMTEPTTEPRWEPTTESDMLDVLADPHPIVGADVPDVFLAACARDAATNSGLVSVNRVRALLEDEDIDPHRYSALWSHFTGKDKPMQKAKGPDGSQLWEVCKGSQSGNDGRPYPLRRWIGTDQESHA